jgi:beta-glucosidase
MPFPSDFMWGSATSSYQIEGASTEDGRGATVWDVFCDTPNKVINGDNGDVACDHYHRYPHDIALMKSLGLKAYRFSVAWSRILPNGIGTVEPRGLAFYDRLVDTILQADITPMLTMFHWDLPQALEDKGGWANRAVLDGWTQYAQVLSEKLGDRVKIWATHNEPWCASILGYVIGEHAPGHHDWKKGLAAAHHLMLSHGIAIDILRQNVPDGQHGIVLNLNPAYATNDSDSAKTAMQRFDGYFNRWFLDPIFKGEYPADLWAFYGDDVPTVHEGDMALISRPIDFLGINYYSRAIFEGINTDMPQNVPIDRLQLVGARTDNPYTAMDWEVYPEGLYDLLMRVNDDYAPKAFYITENGCAYEDVISDDGCIHDVERVAYYAAHVAQCERLLEAGVPLKGYFAWSLMDNFEWAWGYSRRFGITYVNYATQERILKDSALWYKDVIARGGIAE